MERGHLPANLKFNDPLGVAAVTTVTEWCDEAGIGASPLVHMPFAGQYGPAKSVSPRLTQAPKKKLSYSPRSYIFAACYCALELLFNLAWLVLAAVLLFIYGARAPSFAAEHRRITSAIALACILALLFPVISISDDLSCNPDLAESNGSKKWVAAATLARPLLSAWLGAPPPVLGARREGALDAGCLAQSPGFSSSNLNRRPPPALA